MSCCPRWSHGVSLCVLLLWPGATPIGALDCNGNATEDIADIRSGTSDDCNLNTLPDECESLPLEFGGRGESAVYASVPWDLAAADMNGDGIADMVTANRQSLLISSVTVLLARGDGRFEPPQTIDATRSLASLALGDLDGDGDIDVATAHSTVILVFRNSGDGALEPPVEVPVPSGTRFVSIADVTGDGLGDLLWTNSSSGVAGVIASGVDGVFGDPLTLGVDRGPAAIAAADLNGNGHLDLVTTGISGTVSVLLSSGKGGFAAANSVPAGGEGARVLANDLDNDGILDLALPTTDGVSVLLGQGGGLFGKPSLSPISSGSANSLAAGDWDEDGDVDLALTITGSNAAWAYVNVGDGRFQTLRQLGSVWRARDLVAGDFDGDGDLDLGVTTTRPDALSVLWNRERGTLTLSPSTVSVRIGVNAKGTQPHGGAMADFNGDGHLDVVTANGHGVSLAVLLNDGHGSLGTPSLSWFQEALYLFSVDVGDFDGDGDLDFVVADLERDRLIVHENDGQGGFGEQAFYNVAAQPFLVVTGDVTGDGFPDVFCANTGADSVTVYASAGDGTLNLKDRQDLAVGGRPLAVAGGDLDGDGDLDIAAASESSSEVSLLFNRGDGTFQPVVNQPILARPHHVSLGDFDGNGTLDVVTANQASNDFTLLPNAGDGSLTASPSVPMGNVDPFSSLPVDVDGDGNLDVVTANEVSNSASVVLGNGDGTFQRPIHYAVGALPRFTLAGDLDQDGDTDVISIDRESATLTLLTNQLSSLPFDGDFLETICTGSDFHKVSAPGRTGSTIERAGKYILPVRDAPELLGTTFQNVRRFSLHQEFMSAVFPERFPALTFEDFNRVVGNRATRSYYVGILSRLRTDKGPAYGVNIFADTSDAAELLTLEEVTDVIARLGRDFQLRPLGYFPDDFQARETAAQWRDPPFPVYIQDAAPTVAYQAYTRAVGFGRVRVLDPEGFREASESGQIGFQNILVLSFAPGDIEGVVGGVITGALQGELSHLSIRTARRKTPNAFVGGAVETFGGFDGKLVRLQVTETEALIREASVEEAEEFWTSNRPQISIFPQVDRAFTELCRFSEMDLSGEAVPPEARFGGKATNLARLGRVLSGSFDDWVEVGFGIPVHYYLQFLRTNEIPSALDTARVVTYEEHLRELFASEEFASNSEVRFRTLKAFREFARENGEIDDGLVDRIRSRIVEIFGSAETMVRFRSSSNVEDALEFNGAGLYESTGVCVADTLDEDGDGPSLCDPRQPEERKIRRALKKVWTSVFTFRAFEERNFFGVPEDNVAMAVLVSRAFIDERANGVAFTGNISNPLDRRYVITVQPGEASVVNPEPGVLPEKDVLDVVDGEIRRIIRPTTGSTLLPPGQWVLSDEELLALGRVMSHVDDTFPLELGEHARSAVLLDMEIKLESDGNLALKQVRPFLHSVAPPPTPSFELEIPSGLAVCGTFALAGTNRGPRDEYDLKSTARFRSGTFLLETESETFSADIFEAVLFGPLREIATPLASGLFRVARLPPVGGVTTYRFTYEQDFVLADGRMFQMRLATPIALRARDEEPLDGSFEFDPEFFTVPVSAEALRGTINGAPLVRYGSCTYETLPEWDIRATLDDGTTLQLRERFEEAPLPTETAPASITRATVTHNGEERVVTDYWNLVYSAGRHNIDARYWVAFESPLEVTGVESPVHAIELVAFDAITGTQAEASYLGEGFAVLARKTIAVWSKTPANDSLQEPRFLRGDVLGDGAVDLQDALALLDFLFRRGTAAGCEKAADTNDDGRINILDAVALARGLFRNAPPLPGPFPACGEDLTADTLSCRAPGVCGS